MAGANVYGGVFHARLDYIQEKHGRKGIKDVFDRAVAGGYKGPKDRNDFKIKKLYSFNDFLSLLKSYHELYGDADFDKMCREVARKKGIVGFFIKWAGSPDLLIRKAQEYWTDFYDFGRLEGEVMEDNFGVVRGYNMSPDPLFCRSLTQYFTGILENLRLTGIHVRKTKCVHRGDDHCEWDLRWE